VFVCVFGIMSLASPCVVTGCTATCRLAPAAPGIVEKMLYNEYQDSEGWKAVAYRARKLQKCVYKSYQPG